MLTTPSDDRAPAPSPQARPAAATAKICRPERDDAACPACGATMRLWANYYRCQTCGFKESCCF
jgi:hypothetical protein